MSTSGTGNVVAGLQTVVGNGDGNQVSISPPSRPRLIYTGKPEDAPTVIGVGVVFGLDKFANPPQTSTNPDGSKFISCIVTGTLPVRIELPPGFICTMYSDGPLRVFLSGIDGVPFQFDWMNATNRNATFVFTHAIVPDLGA